MPMAYKSMFASDIEACIQVHSYAFVPLSPIHERELSCINYYLLGYSP